MSSLCIFIFILIEVHLGLFLICGLFISHKFGWFLITVDFSVYNCDMSRLSFGYLLLDYCSVVQCDWIRV